MAPPTTLYSPRELSDDIVGTLVFAERENPKHAVEKPYNMRFDPGNGLARSNMEYETQKVKLHDLRYKDFNFDQHGLQMVEHQSTMQYEDFANATMVEDIYLSEVATMLEKLLNVHDVYIFEYVIRRRHSEFPKPSVDLEKHNQPAVTAHIDFTEADLDDRIRQIFGDKAQDHLKRPYIAINVWKPLLGPVQDWPLAYCDPATVDVEHDLLVVDEVSRKNASELYNIHHNENHSWYYVKDQQPWEMMVFSEHDSRSPKKRSVPHCSFVLEGATAPARRESIEVRTLAFL